MNSLSYLLRRYDDDKNLSQFYEELNILSEMDKNIFFQLNEPVQDLSSLLAIFKASHETHQYPHNIQTPIYLYLGILQISQSLSVYKNAILHISKMIAAIEYDGYYEYKNSHEHINAFLEKTIPQENDRLILQTFFLGARQHKQTAWLERTFLAEDGDRSLFIGNIIQMNVLATFFAEHHISLQNILKPQEYDYLHTVVMENAILLSYVMQQDDDFVIEETLALQKINRSLVNDSVYSQYFTAYEQNDMNRLSDICANAPAPFGEDLQALHHLLNLPSCVNNMSPS